MTAHFVLLAQTKVGFLSGGRSRRRMKELPQKEVLAQLEKAYARATVALTRAQKLCIIMGPLDMRGLLGAATVIGCLKYGAGVCGVHVDNPSAEVFLKERTPNAGPDDSAFLQSLRWSLNTPRGAYPPVALVEIYRESKHPLTKIRRLHLIVVDLDKTWSVSKRVYQDFKKCQIPADLAGCLNTLPVPIPKWDCPFRVRLSLPMEWTIRTGLVTCYGHAEETVGTSGWLIRGLATSLILLQQGSLHQSDWNISLMRLP